MRRVLERVYATKKAVFAAVAGAYAVYAMSAGGFTDSEAQAALSIVFGVVAVYLAENE
jgi:hypothetical protein